MALKAQPSQGLRTYRKSPSASLRITPVTVPLGSRENCQTPSSESNRVSDWGTIGKTPEYKRPFTSAKVTGRPGKPGGPSRNSYVPAYVAKVAGLTFTPSFILPTR